MPRKRLGKLAQLIARSGLPENICARQAQSLLWEVIGISFLRVNGEKPEAIKRYENALMQLGKDNFTQHFSVSDYEQLWIDTRDRSIAGLKALTSS